MLLCLAASAREWHQLRQVPQLRRSTAASPGVCKEEAGREAVLKPALGKWPSIAGEQLVGKGPGAAGGHQGERERQPAFGQRGPAVSWAACGGVWPEAEGGDPCPPPRPGEATPAVLCPVLGSPAQERRGAT